jgi:hypothetical protein
MALFVLIPEVLVSLCQIASVTLEVGFVVLFCLKASMTGATSSAPLDLYSRICFTTEENGEKSLNVAE